MLRLRFAFAAFVAIFSAPALWAEDLALLLGNRGQIGVFQDANGANATEFRNTLEQSGFRIIEPTDRDIRSMRLAAISAETALGRGGVDRLLIVATGPFASDGQDSWILSNNAVGATRIGIGALGISMNALTTLAASQDIPVVIMVAPGADPGGLATGLEPGPVAYRQPDRITYVTGPSRVLSAMLLETVLANGVSFAEMAEQAPDGVSVTGDLSPRMGLMGPAALPNSEAAIEQGYWRAIQAMDTIEAYRLYLREYPLGGFRSDARDRIAFLRDEPERLAQAAEERLNLSRDDRRELQRDLALLGHDPGGIDGILGRGSRAAIRGWQRTNGFDETGFITGNQRVRLRAQAQEEAARQEEEARLRRAEEERRDRAYWRQTGRGSDEPGLRAYLERYPDGLFSDLAQERLEEIEEIKRAEAAQEEREAWDAARQADNEEGYRAFLSTYPESGFADAARARLSELTQADQNAAIIEAARQQERQFTSTLVGRVLIEQRLAQLGADPGNPDGRFTEQTRKAIRRFQRSRDLPVTGYISQDTMVRLLGGR